MSVPKKDYGIIADVIAIQLTSVCTDATTQYAQHEAIKRVAIALCTQFVKNNSRFQPHRFLARCGFTVTY